MPNWDDGPRRPRSPADGIPWSKKTMRQGQKKDGCPLTALILLGATLVALSDTAWRTLTVLSWMGA